MLLSLETDFPMENLKFTAEQKLKHLILPSSAVKRLNEILTDDRISSEEFVKEMQAIEASANNLSWKIQVYFHKLSTKLSDQISTISFLNLIAAVLFLFFLNFLYKKFKSEKKLAPIRNVLSSLIIRFGAMLGYLPPIISLYAYYIPILIGNFPVLAFLIPGYIRVLLAIYERIWHVEYVYFFSVVWIVIVRRWPKPRFIRFHIVKGLLYFTMQQIPLTVYFIFLSGLYQTAEYRPEHVPMLLFCFVLNMLWLLPGIWEALTLNYPKFYALRESVELNLGRDNNEDGFKWWDRKK